MIILIRKDNPCYRREYIVKKNLSKQMNNKLFISINMDTPYLAPLDLFPVMDIPPKKGQSTL